MLKHTELIGQPDGSVVANSAGHEYLALRPLLRDFVMSMPRGAAIVYPKDAAQIVSQADVFPGAVVVEAGVGSGALSLWLLRAIGADGRLISFERRAEFAEVARANVETFLGGAPRTGRSSSATSPRQLPRRSPPASVDRVVLDMLAPWECIDVVADALTPGGVVLCYVATATQLSRVAEYIRGTGLFTDPEASETMVRGWHVEGLAVRPDHRMVAHTGFLIWARRLAPGAVAPEQKRRASKSSYGDEDVELWTPGAVGDREITDKNLRKRVREAQRAADGARRGVDSGAPSSDPRSAWIAARLFRCARSPLPSRSSASPRRPRRLLLPHPPARRARGPRGDAAVSIGPRHGARHPDCRPRVEVLHAVRTTRRRVRGHDHRRGHRDRDDASSSCSTSPSSAVRRTRRSSLRLRRRPLAGRRSRAGLSDPRLADALMCATEGSRVVVGLAPGDIEAETRGQPRPGEDESAVAVVDVRKVYLAEADGANQFNSGSGLPTVVRAPDGRPGSSSPTGTRPTELVVQTLKKGDGEVVTGDQPVRVHYTGVTVGRRDRLRLDLGRRAASLTLDGVVPGLARRSRARPSARSCSS